MSTATQNTKPRFSFKRKPPPPKPDAQIRPDGSRDVELPIMEHLRELRSRLMKAALAIILTTALCLIFAEQMVTLITKLATDRDYEIQAIEVGETFGVYLQVAFTAGIALSMPLLVYQLYRFLAPGLTKTEKVWAFASLPFVTFFFLLGVVFCYFLVLPNATTFLLGFGEGAGIKNVPRISKLVDFVTTFLLAVGLAFETPVIVFILAKLGVATPLRLRRFRRWFYVLAFVVAAVITPTPNPTDQVVVAIPIIILYEVGILCARIGTRKPKKAAVSV